jgi:tRNA(Ile2) C34 agmatinyltransferase TiaS
MSGIAQGLGTQPEDTKDVGAEVRRMFPGAASIDHAAERRAFEGLRDREREEWERDRALKLKKLHEQLTTTGERR